MPKSKQNNNASKGSDIIHHSVFTKNEKKTTLNRITSGKPTGKPPKSK